MLNTELYDDFDLLLPPDQALTLCRQAVADLGWRVLDQGPDFVRAKEVAVGLSFNWPAEVQVVVESDEPQRATVYLDGKIFGLGPIQKGHLQGQMGNLRNRIELLASQASVQSSGSTSSGGSLTDELQKLAALREQGILTEEEFQQAKARLLG